MGGRHDWILERSGGAGDDGVSAGINCDALAGVVAFAAKIGGIKQCRACGIQLENEDFLRALEGGLEGAGEREVSGHGGSRDVGVQAAVDGYACGGVGCGTAYNGVEDDHGIDDERLGMIIAGEFEAHGLTGVNLIIGSDFDWFAIELLVDLGLFLNEVAGGGGKDEVTCRVRSDGVDAVVGKFNAVGVGPGGKDEVVFELTLVTVEDEVDAGVDVAALYFGELGDAGDPVGGILADQVIADARKAFDGLVFGGAKRVERPHADDGRPGGGGKDYGVAGNEEARVADVREI